MISMIAAIVELFLFFGFYFCFSFFFYLSDRSDHMETRLNLLPVHENKQTKKKKKKNAVTCQIVFYFHLSVSPKMMETLLKLIYNPGLNYWTFLSLYLCFVLFCLLLLLFLLFCNRMACFLKKEKE